MAAVAAVRRLGAAAEPSWQAALDVPALRPYAKMALTGIAGAPRPELEQEPGDIAWLLVDLLAATGEATGPGELAAELAGWMPEGTGDALFDAMARLRHPDAVAVLTLIGEQHPDKKIAKAARRYAYKASSRAAASASASRVSAATSTDREKT
jgi:hypothetical protein